MASGRSVIRTLETGVVLGLITLVLGTTGLLISPTVMTSLFGGALKPSVNDKLYIVHLTSAVLLAVFLLIHLFPFAFKFLRNATMAMLQRISAVVLLFLVIVEVWTGCELYFHAYVLFSKQAAVYTHLISTFLLLPPLAVHSVRGWQVFVEPG